MEEEEKEKEKKTVQRHICLTMHVYKSVLEEIKKLICSSFLTKDYI